jgi:hypothetical protein
MGTTVTCSGAWPATLPAALECDVTCGQPVLSTVVVTLRFALLLCQGTLCGFTFVSEPTPQALPKLSRHSAASLACTLHELYVVLEQSDAYGRSHDT